MHLNQNALRMAAVRTAVEVMTELAQQSASFNEHRPVLCVSIDVQPDGTVTVDWHLGLRDAGLMIRIGIDDLAHETGAGVVYDALHAAACGFGIKIADERDPLADLRQVSLGLILSRGDGEFTDSEFLRIVAIMAYDPFCVRFECGFPELEFMPLGEQSVLVGLCGEAATEQRIDLGYFVILDDEDIQFLPDDPRHCFLKSVLLRRSDELLAALAQAESEDWWDCECKQCEGQVAQATAGSPDP